MKKEEVIAYHEDKINRLYEDRDRIQDYLHIMTAKDRHITTTELLDMVKKFVDIDKDLKTSCDIRLAMMNLEA